MGTIGKLLSNNKVELEYSGQGYIYKDGLKKTHVVYSWDEFNNK